MKRDFLRELGIADEAINKIMAENGKDIETAKGELETFKQTAAAKDTEIEGYKAQLAQRDSDIETLKQSATDNDKVKATLDELRCKYDADTQALKQKLLDQQTAYERDKATEKFFGGVEFSSTLTKEAGIAQFKAKGFQLENGSFLGGTDWLNALRQSAPDAFKAAEPEDKPKPPAFTKPIGGGNQPPNNPFVFGFNKVR